VLLDRRRRWRALILFLGFTALAYGAVRFKRDTLVDFVVYHRAAIRTIDAEPLYRPDDGHYQFKYLPAFAMAMAPFAVLDRETASGLWFAISAALMVVFLRGSVHALPDRRLRISILLAIASVLLAKSFVKELAYGQTNLLFGVILLLAFRAAGTRHDVLAGALVGADVFVKPYAVLMLPWIVAARGLPAALGAGAVIAIGLLLPALIYGWTGNIALLGEWFRTVTETSGPLLTFAENISIAGMWAKWIGIGPAATRWSAATIVALAILIAMAWFRRNRRDDPDYLVFGLILLMVPLASPQGWDYVVLLGAPAMVLVVDRWREMPIAWRAIAVAGLAVIGFSVFEIVGRAGYRWLMATSAITVGAILVVLSAARLRWLRLA
jgi:hypothetical protein